MSKYAKEITIINRNFKVIDDKMNSLSGLMLQLKMETAMLNAGKSKLSSSDFRILCEDIINDLNIATKGMTSYLEFMLNNEDDEFKELLKQGADIKRKIDMLSERFIPMINEINYILRD